MNIPFLFSDEEDISVVRSFFESSNTSPAPYIFESMGDRLHSSHLQNLVESEIPQEKGYIMSANVEKVCGYATLIHQAKMQGIQEADIPENFKNMRLTLVPAKDQRYILYQPGALSQPVFQDQSQGYRITLQKIRRVKERISYNAREASQRAFAGSYNALAYLPQEHADLGCSIALRWLLKKMDSYNKSNFAQHVGESCEPLYDEETVINLSEQIKYSLVNHHGTSGEGRPMRSRKLFK